MHSRQRERDTFHHPLESTSVSNCSAPPPVDIEDGDLPQYPRSNAINKKIDDEDDVSSTGVCVGNNSIGSISTCGGDGGGHHRRYATAIHPTSPLLVTPTSRHKSLPSLSEVMSRVPDGISLPHHTQSNHLPHHTHLPLETSTSSQTSRSGFVSILRRNVSSPSTTVDSLPGENDFLMASLSNVSSARALSSPSSALRALSSPSSAPFAAVPRGGEHHQQQQRKPHHHHTESGSSCCDGVRAASATFPGSCYTITTGTAQPHHKSQNNNSPPTFCDMRIEATTSFNLGSSPSTKAALRLRQSLLEDRVLNCEGDHSCRPISDAMSSHGVGIGCGSSSGHEDEWGDDGDGCTSEIHHTSTSTTTTGHHHHSHPLQNRQSFATTRVEGARLHNESDDDEDMDPLQLKGHMSVNGPPALPSLKSLNVYSSRHDSHRYRSGETGPLVAESKSLEEMGQASATASFRNSCRVRGEGSFSGMFTWDETRQCDGEESESEHSSNTSPTLLVPNSTAGSTPCKTVIRRSTNTKWTKGIPSMKDGDRPPSFADGHDVGITAPVPFVPAMLSLSSPGNVSLQIQSHVDSEDDDDDDDNKVGSLSSALASRILRATDCGGSTSGPFRAISNSNTALSSSGGGGVLGESSPENITHLIDIHLSHSLNWTFGMNSANSDIGNRLAQSMPAHTVSSPYSSTSNTKSLSSRHQVGVPSNKYYVHQSQPNFSLSASSSSSHQLGGCTKCKTASPRALVEINSIKNISTALHHSAAILINANATVSSTHTTVVSVQPSVSQDCSSSAYTSLLDRPLGDADDPLGVSMGSTASSRRHQQPPSQLGSVSVHPCNGGGVVCSFVELSVSSVGVSGSHQTAHSSTALDTVPDERDPDTTTTVVVVSPPTNYVAGNSLSTDPDDPEYEESLREQTRRMLEEGFDISDVEALKRRKRRLRRRIRVANSAWEASRAASAPGTPSLLDGSGEPRPIRRTRATIVEVFPQ